MLEVEKRKNAHDYDVFAITTEEGTFEISFQNNLDLYWRYCYEGNILDTLATHTFTITKENYFIYSLFDNLYNSIKEGNPYKGYSDNLKKFNNELLFKNNIIDWHSDDFDYDKASCVMIEKLEEQYKITFKKSKPDWTQGLFITYCVRFSNSGSRYKPFNVAFINMYQDLKKYNFDYHQIHMEEYLYNLEKQKILKRKSIK